MAILISKSEESHEKSSTIIATQTPVENCYRLIGESTIADAILDRIAFSLHRNEPEGEFLGKYKN
ncbi:MAG: hypothetical protein EOO93_13175 [Pedobacter sp.]|nr:MAG: hypothetical protein EOO93_13175 [Pedobacter sp.]